MPTPKTAPQVNQAEVSLEFHNNLPPNIAFVQTADGRRVFEDGHGNMAFGMWNTTTGKVYVSTVRIPLVGDDHHAVLDIFRIAIQDAIRVLNGTL